MENVQNNLEKSILATVAYFDVFNYPLTDVEIWKWLFVISDFRFSSADLNFQSSEVSLSEIQKILENSEIIKSLVGSAEGFYFLKNREELVNIRQVRYVLAEKKIKRARRVARFLKFIPGIKMIAVCNSLAWTNAREESDIDFFVVTARNKIWTTRFWAAGFLQIFGLRPSGRKTKDKICLSFFVNEENLNLEPLALGAPDIYLIYWVTQLVPLFDRGGVYQKFWQANTWVKKFLPNIFSRDVGGTISSAGLPQKHASQESFPNGVSTVKDGLLEKFFRWLQLKMMPKNLKEMANHDSRVMVTDKILKFHANDRREEYKKLWEDKISKLV